MTQAKLDQLMELIGELVNDGSASWKERRDSVLENIDEKDRTALEEFASWFEVSQ